ncbi:pantoate--beta-alanine ligase [Labrys okinawensis]|uniref:pantoate--beta-alanine ligase n=1 Tax=Labrys okinawensis TaxID=346911 RepID=UPI0039BD2B0E
MPFAIVRTVSKLRDTVSGWRRANLRVALVPTMGALHEGHLSLVRAAFESADRVIVTLFVNPTQFDSQTDLAAYPRTEDDDVAKLLPTGAHVLYASSAAEIYPAGFATSVSVSSVSAGLCGAFRPGHFDGVATVVTKLLLQTGADIACFGEKDFQQLKVVTQLVRDLDIRVTIVGCPTIRESDGLALSSRNTRLDLRARRIAPVFHQVLKDAAKRLLAGEPVPYTLTWARSAIVGCGYDSIEYLELRAEDDLAPASGLERPARLIAAAWLAGVRLVDNVKVESDGPLALIH